MAELYVSAPLGLAYWPQYSSIKVSKLEQEHQYLKDKGLAEVTFNRGL
jgi:hypothetical protein